MLLASDYCSKFLDAVISPDYPDGGSDQPYAPRKQIKSKKYHPILSSHDTFTIQSKKSLANPPAKNITILKIATADAIPAP